MFSQLKSSLLIIYYINDLLFRFISIWEHYGYGFNHNFLKKVNIKQILK